MLLLRTGLLLALGSAPQAMPAGAYRVWFVAEGRRQEVAADISIVSGKLAAKVTFVAPGGASFNLPVDSVTFRAPTLVLALREGRGNPMVFRLSPSGDSLSGVVSAGTKTFPAYARRK